ncbi:zinc finger protein [Actinoalloteichus hymeniacidonis]|uniref:Zinc-finger n=1 Tax=Actinoalloteichus hymeniacidonis TaxID=340345 RepID=A0AAC9MZZ9_9PSEU|nr:zinc finger protein [Actinoalloteichus hymeniacidonis]AOS65968.1 hypothetical protein TL08_25995 [Actinoalloteichus hymeniacidonis]MBB5905932.1 hypothetical protein [Actinoalloteichus hymeniacidonis]
MDNATQLFWEAIRPAKGMVWDRHAAAGVRPDPGVAITALCGVPLAILTQAERAGRLIDRTCLTCADRAWKLRNGFDWPQAP